MAFLKSLTIEDVRARMLENGDVLLSEKVGGAHQKLDILCINDHAFKKRWNNYQQGERCQACVKSGLVKVTAKRCRKDYNRKWREDTRYYEKNRDNLLQRSADWYATNREEVIARGKSEETKAKQAKWREKNKEHLRESNRLWREKNKEHLRERRIEVLKTDVQTRIRRIMSRKIAAVLGKTGLKKNWNSWPTILGYNAQELKEHLEKRFRGSMAWDNYGTFWCIDHITPLILYGYKSMLDESFKKAWSLNNLQPLTLEENKFKSDWLPDGTRARHAKYRL